MAARKKTAPVDPIVKLTKKRTLTGPHSQKKGSDKDVYHETGNLYGENECQLGDLGLSYLYLSVLTIEKLHET